MLIVHHQGEATRHSFLTDTSGRASFELDTSGWTGTVTLHVSNLCHPRGFSHCFVHWYGAGHLLQAKKTARVSGARCRVLEAAEP